MANESAVLGAAALTGTRAAAGQAASGTSPKQPPVPPRTLLPSEISLFELLHVLHCPLGWQLAVPVLRLAFCEL